MKLKQQAQDTVQTVKANPIKAFLITLLLSGGGGGLLTYDIAMDFLNMPSEIKILRWRQEQLLRICMDNDMVDQSALFKIFFTPVDSMNVTGGSNK